MKEKITVSIDKDLLEFINELANKDSRSLSSTVNKIIRDYQIKNKDKNPTTSIL